MINLAILGSGYIGRQHCQSQALIDDVKLCAVISLKGKGGEELAEEFGANYYETLKEANEKEKLDAIIICTPTFLHRQHVEEAAGMGLHVLCEKPAALSVEDFDAMVKACEDNNVKLMIAQICRWDPWSQDIKDCVVNKKLGKLRYYSACRLSQVPGWGTWQQDPKLSGGALYDMNIHDIDLTYYFFGMPKTVYATGWANEQGAWMHVDTALRYDELQANVESSLAMPGDYPFAVFQRLTGDDNYYEYVYHLDENAVGSDFDNREYADEQQGFYDYAFNGKESPVPNADVRNVLRIVEATKQSLETGKSVDME